jgi:hypothetical protein
VRADCLRRGVPGSRGSGLATAHANSWAAAATRMDPPFRHLVMRTLDTITPLLSAREQEDVAAWLDGHQAWLALEQALGHASQDGLKIPMGILDELASPPRGHRRRSTRCPPLPDLAGDERGS